MTGLANRRAFDESARRIVSSVKKGRHQAALLMIDIDSFKAINDTLGHAEATIEDETLPFHFTVSIGVTGFKPTDESIEAVTRRADAAMYQAKHEGRNRVATRW